MLLSTYHWRTGLGIRLKLGRKRLPFCFIFCLLLLHCFFDLVLAYSSDYSSDVSQSSHQVHNFTMDCLSCNYDYSCNFGEKLTVKCIVKDQSNCVYHKAKVVHLNYTCAYCHQFPESNYVCAPSFSCKINAKYLAECTMKSHVLCLGNRTFHRYRACNIITGYKWSTALLLSITVGGFGIDRFYLGYWQEGIGKLFSFGGFGVWTLVDIILIATGYLKPADGSRYVNDLRFG